MSGQTPAPIAGGVLVAKHYPSDTFERLADHTYVECSTGAKAWACWGGKSGGQELRRGAGSTLRADAIAEPNERAAIACYAINGVCHQAANRILLPAGILVDGARGYRVSEALFGVYGRLGFWPCSAPFDRHDGVTGDLQPCLPATPGGRAGEEMIDSRSDEAYIRGALDIYDSHAPADAPAMIEARSPGDEVALQVDLFAHMLSYRLEELDDGQRSAALDLRRSVEERRLDFQPPPARAELTGRAHAEQFNELAVEFQQEMSGILNDQQYEQLFQLSKGDWVILADPDITENGSAG